MLPVMALAGADDGVSVTADGIAVVAGEDIGQARDMAVTDALRKVVEQAVGTMIASETVIENYQLLSDQVYSKAQGYVQSYKIVSEKREDKIYRVIVNAVVGKSGLKDDLAGLGLLLARKNMPRVMLMIVEQNIGQERVYYWWFGGSDERAGQADLSVAENVLMQKLVEKGFPVVDHGIRTKTAKISKAYRRSNLSDDAVQDIGDLFGADIVIYGKALAKSHGTVMNSPMRSALADISLRAVNTDDGRVIATSMQNGAAVHPSEVTAGGEALKKVSEDAAEDLIGKMVARFSRDVSGSGMVQIEILGNKPVQSVSRFRDVIKSRVRGVTKVYQRGTSNGVASLEVETGFSAQDLADQFQKLQISGLTVIILDVSHNVIRLELNE